MKKLILLILIILTMSIVISAQNINSNTTAKPLVGNANLNSNEAKRPPVFRASKDQVMQAQTMLKQKGLLSTEATGKLDDPTRDALRKFQESEKIRVTGTLNRVTIEKMGIQLTDKQKSIPVSASSLKSDSDSNSKTRSSVFRATKDQIMQAQKMLLDKKLYVGAQDGKMSDEFRASLRKYQEIEKIKITGTLNQETLGKMGIQLTENQKVVATSAAKTN